VFQFFIVENQPTVAGETPFCKSPAKVQFERGPGASAFQLKRTLVILSFAKPKGLSHLLVTCNWIIQLVLLLSQAPTKQTSATWKMTLCSFLAGAGCQRHSTQKPLRSCLQSQHFPRIVKFILRKKWKILADFFKLR